MDPNNFAPGTVGSAFQPVNTQIQIPTSDNVVRGRKRVRDDDDSCEWRETQKSADDRRKEQNRIFAKKSRERKRQYVEEIEVKCTQLSEENEKLKAKIKSLEKLVRTQSIALTHASSTKCSESDFFGPGSASVTTIIEKNEEQKEQSVL